MKELKNVDQLKNEINYILNTGANDIRLIHMIESYIETNYSTDWKIGDTIGNGLNLTKIVDIELCALINYNYTPAGYEPIRVLKSVGYKKIPNPEITYEAIASKFNVDVDTVKRLLNKLK